MTHQRASGLRLVQAVIVAIVTLSLLAIVSFNSLIGTARLAQQIVRFLLTIVLCVFLYRGANWARWVTAIMCFASGVAALGAEVVLLHSGASAILLIDMGLIYLGCFGTLLFVPSVRAYFDHSPVKMNFFGVITAPSDSLPVDRNRWIELCQSHSDLCPIPPVIKRNPFIPTEKMVVRVPKDSLRVVVSGDEIGRMEWAQDDSSSISVWGANSSIVPIAQQIASSLSAVFVRKTNDPNWDAFQVACEDPSQSA